jgi:hypothetical protein
VRRLEVGDGGEKPELTISWDERREGSISSHLLFFFSAFFLFFSVLGPVLFLVGFLKLAGCGGFGVCDCC